MCKLQSRSENRVCSVCASCNQEVKTGFVLCGDCAGKIKDLEAQLQVAKRIIQDDCPCRGCKHEFAGVDAEPCKECLYLTHELEESWYPKWEWRGTDKVYVRPKEGEIK